jgi:predicted regulator of Ras-like GTPase activity (Roadblock/LC7/MglB family)
MNLSLLRFLKWGRGAQAGVAEPPPLPAVVIEKPASERFSHTVMPNVSRFVGLTPQGESNEAVLAGLAPGVTAPASSVAPAFASAATSASAPRTVSLGNLGLAVKAGASESAKGPAPDRTISLQLLDLAPHLPEGLLKATPIEPGYRVLLPASELERGMSSGQPSVHLRAIYQQAPDFFTRQIDEADETEVALPFGKVLEQFTALQVRADQVREEAIPEVETPFLQLTAEDGLRFGAASVPVAPPAPPPRPEPAAIAQTEPTAPIRLPLPPEAQRAIAAVAAAPAEPIRIDPTRAPVRTPASAPLPASAPEAKKIAFNLSPNGTGEPASERVPASSGSSVPTPRPAAPGPGSTAGAAAPPRIAFKISPPSNDLRTPIAPRTSAPGQFSAGGPCLRLPLGKILRAIAPTQLSGPREEVPETARIELPFSIVQPQLSSGKVSISPSQFQSALPQEWRGRLQMEDMETPIPLDLQAVLQNLPGDSLQIRSDQEAADVGSFFETPFSRKAAEDASRLAPPPVRPDVNAAIAPASTPPATKRTELQIEFDTDEVLDARAVVARASTFPGVKACAVVFSDGLSLAGNLPAQYEADALCAMGPAIMKKIGEQMAGARLGTLNSVTVFCAGAAVTFFTHGNICLAALHAAEEPFASEVRLRLDRVARGQDRANPQSA